MRRIAVALCALLAVVVFAPAIHARKGLGQDALRHNDWYTQGMPKRARLLQAVNSNRTVTCQATPDDVLGPYYQAQVPFKPTNVSFCRPAQTPAVAKPVPSVAPITITGRIFDAKSCNTTVRNVTMEVWQADNTGNYDDISTPNTHNCRTKFRLPANGTYSYVTIMPSRYGNPSCLRPAHIHLKVTAPGYTTLVTQMYFVGDPFRGENDCGCSSCGSGDPLKATKLDTKTKRGVFNIYLAKA